MILVAHKYDRNHESEKQMGNIVLEGLRELAENPARIWAIPHNRCLGLGRSCQDKAERLWKGGGRSAKNKPKTFSGLDPGSQERPISLEVEWMVAFVICDGIIFRRLWEGFSRQIHYYFSQILLCHIIQTSIHLSILMLINSLYIVNTLGRAVSHSQFSKIYIQTAFLWALRLKSATVW